MPSRTETRALYMDTAGVRLFGGPVDVSGARAVAVDVRERDDTLLGSGVCEVKASLIPGVPQPLPVRTLLDTTNRAARLGLAGADGALRGAAWLDLEVITAAAGCILDVFVRIEE